MKTTKATTRLSSHEISARVLLGLLLACGPGAAMADTCTWTGNVGSWSTAGGWSCAHVPGTADSVVINSGALSLAGNATITGLLFQYGDFTNNGDLTITGSMSWEGGDLLGSGTTRVDAGATLLLTGGNHSIQGTFVNAGVATWQAGQLDSSGHFSNEGELIVAANVTNDPLLCFSGTAAYLTNTATGLIRRTGTGLVRIYCPFVNDGMVRIENGGLGLTNGGSSSGAYEIEAAGTLVFLNSHAMGATTSLTGQGTVEVRNGTTTLAGSYDLATTRFVDGTFQINVNATTGTLEMAGGTLEGSGDLTVSESLTWTAGTMQGSGTTHVVPGATLVIDDGTQEKHLSGTRTLLNEGSGTWSGTVRFSNANTALFANSGILDMSAATTNGAGIFFAGNFINTGTLTIDSGAVTGFSSGFNNEGTVEITSGTLKLSGFSATGGADSGTFSIASGAVLEYAGGNHTLTDTALIHGSGTVGHSAGGLTNNATIAPGSSPGTLTWMSVEPFAPTGAAVLDIEIGGYAPGTEHDVLAIEGRADPAGTVQVTLTNGFVPNANDEITILTATEGVCREFDTELLPPGYRLIYYPTEVRFAAGPPDDRLFAHGFERNPCDP